MSTTGQDFSDNHREFEYYFFFVIMRSKQLGSTLSLNTKKQSLVNVIQI